MPDLPPYPGTPRWVKVFGITALVVVLLVLGQMIFGGGHHGPMRHAPPGDSAGHGSPGVGPR